MTGRVYTASDVDCDVLDVAPILKSLGVLKKDSDDRVPLDKAAGDAFLDAMRDPEKVTNCVTHLFPIAIPVDQKFFEQLDEFHQWIGVADSGDEALGLVWSEAVRRLSPAQRQELLDVFARQEGHEFFENARSLYVVTREHALPAEFLSTWFVDLVRAVERDMMQESVWKSIRMVCTSHVDIALETLNIYLTQPDTYRCRIAGFMLGVLRSGSRNERQAAEFTRIEKEFGDNRDISLRAVFNWSWVTTARDLALTQDNVNMLLVRADGSPDNLNNIVCVICCLISNECLPGEIAVQCREWVTTTITPALSVEAKLNVVAAVSRLQRSSGGATLGELNWIVAIQPVSAGEVSTWDRIGDFLCDVLKRDVDAFTTLFIALSLTSASAIHGLMAKRRMSHLVNELRNAEVSSLATTLALSADTPTRKLGLFLLDELEIGVFPESVIESSDPVGHQLLFYESERTILKPATIGRILAALVPAAEKSSEGFRDDFFTELKLQCHNFSGGCRQELEGLAKDKPLVAKALADVADYFEALKNAHKAGVNAMEVSGFRKAARMYRRLFSKKVSEGARSGSTFLSMIKHVSLLYGQTSSQFIDGTLRDATPLAQMSHSMEIPLVDFFDPEEMAVRRLHASTVISRLLQVQDGDCEVLDE